jgi:glycosyltransferase involved in cell wall biosynthesis
VTSRLPVISIVTPSFNQVAYLQATLASVLDQEYPELDYVVVDAGSTDGSREAVERVADRLAWWCSEPDDGHIDGLNKGFHHTRGEIMGWVNSSDVQLPWTLRTVAGVFRDVPEAQWIIGMQTVLADDGLPTGVFDARWNRYDFLGGRYRWMQQESVFWRRPLWEAAGGRIDPAVRYACDFDLWLKFMDLAPLYHVPVPLGAYRQHGERRGTADGGAYGAETRAMWERWAAAKPARERRRGRLAAAPGGRIGDLWRETLDRLPLAPWYRRHRVEFDERAGKWVTR